MRKDDHLIFENYKSKLHVMSQDDQGERDWEKRQLEIAAKVCAKVFKTGEPYVEIIDGVSDEYGLDPMLLARTLNNNGILDDEELREFEAYVSATPGENAENPAVNQADWGDSYQEVKGLIDQVLSYGLDKGVLSGVLKYAEEVGYTGEGVDNLIKLIQHFNQKGVQDS